jgi:hypothetical protein
VPPRLPAKGAGKFDRRPKHRFKGHFAKHRVNEGVTPVAQDVTCLILASFRWGGVHQICRILL